MTVINIHPFHQHAPISDIMAQQQLAIKFAPFPDPSVRPFLTQEHWDDLIVSWAAATKAQAQQLKADDASVHQDEALIAFLVSWMEANASGATIELKPAAGLRLAKNVYALACHLLENDSPDALLSWEFLADFSAVYSRSSSAGSGTVTQILDRILGTEGPKQAVKSLAELKKALVQSLHIVPKGDLEMLTATISRVIPLVAASSVTANQLFSGSDFVDGLVSAYRTMHPQLRDAIVSITYLCLTGLTKGNPPNLAMLGDQLFALKAAADAHRDGPRRVEDSLVPELVSITPVISKLRRSISNAAPSIHSTLATRLDALEAYRRPGAEAEARRKARRLKGPSKAAKGKGRALDVDLGHAMSEVRLATISLVQDAFPHLGQGFIARLLDEYGDDANRAMSGLYDELPPHLAEADRAETLETYMAPTYFEPQVPSRKNAFDGDELDMLAVQTSKLSFGKTLNERTVDDILNDRSSAPSKDQIKSALQSFDPDEDERDDTYDADDVGGAVPVADNPEDEEEGPMDEALFQAYRKNPEAFDRTPEVRKSAERARLRDTTGQTDDAIEGWAFMLAQNPRRQRLLEQRYGIERISQREILRTSYRPPRGDDDEEEGESDRSVGRGGFRGNYGRNRGRGGNVAGSPGDKGTENARRRKEASKGSRANHNRREGHAKKMARGGFAP
jgi:activating signal cointegrator complex subunit 2